ncbi:hypothetical protein Gasu2_21590 [Galdieria sulphuraria]|nr:hypothetical protein Gasu2_21590 [Galdieria sulphuraria]
MGGDTHRPSRGNLSFSRPRGRGGRGKKESVNNTKTENKVQRSVQNSSTVDVQQDFEISSSNKLKKSCNKDMMKPCIQLCRALQGQDFAGLTKSPGVKVQLQSFLPKIFWPRFKLHRKTLKIPTQPRTVKSEIYTNSRHSSSN